MPPAKTITTPSAKKATPTISRRRSLRTAHLHIPKSCSKNNLKSTEDQILEDMKRFAFKASPLNRKILEKGHIGSGIPLVLKQKKTTVVRPFKFATDERLNLKKKVAEETATVGKKETTTTASVSKRSTAAVKVAPVVKVVARPTTSRGPLKAVNTPAVVEKKNRKSVSQTPKSSFKTPKIPTPGRRTSPRKRLSLKTPGM